MKMSAFVTSFLSPTRPNVRITDVSQTVERNSFISILSTAVLMWSVVKCHIVYIRQFSPIPLFYLALISGY